jgi:hypothetical protein
LFIDKLEQIQNELALGMTEKAYKSHTLARLNGHRPLVSLQITTVPPKAYLVAEATIIREAHLKTSKHSLKPLETLIRCRKEMQEDNETTQARRRMGFQYFA